MKHGKKYVDSVKAVDLTKLYDPSEALALACQTAPVQSKIAAVVTLPTVQIMSFALLAFAYANATPASLRATAFKSGQGQI